MSLGQFSGSQDGVKVDKQSSECQFKQHKRVSDISDVRTSNRIRVARQQISRQFQTWLKWSGSDEIRPMALKHL